MKAKVVKDQAEVALPGAKGPVLKGRMQSELGPAFFFDILFPPDFPAYADPLMKYANYGGGTDIPGTHYHEGLEIALIHKGRGAFLIGSKRMAFATGDIFIIDGSVPHVAFYAAPCVCSWLYFDLRTFFGPQRTSLQTATSKVFAQKAFDNAFRSREYPQLAALVRQLVDEFARKGPCYQEIIRGLLLAVLAMLERLRIEGDRHFSPREEKPLSSLVGLGKAIDFMHDRFSEKIGNEELARTACMSTTHFRHQFRRNFGMPPHVYLTLFRLRMACEQLKSGEAKIDTVADACGFEDASSFRRAFKKAFGTSPAAWKRAATRITVAR